MIGRYPDVLLSAWLDWDELHVSDNDNPCVFTEDQQYIVFEYANGGTDMEHFAFRNAAQVRTNILVCAIYSSLYPNPCTRYSNSVSYTHVRTT